MACRRVLGLERPVLGGDGRLAGLADCRASFGLTHDGLGPENLGLPAHPFFTRGGGVSPTLVAGACAGH